MPTFFENSCSKERSKEVSTHLEKEYSKHAANRSASRGGENVSIRETEHSFHASMVAGARVEIDQIRRSLVDVLLSTSARLLER